MILKTEIIKDLIKNLMKILGFLWFSHSEQKKGKLKNEKKRLKEEKKQNRRIDIQKNKIRSLSANEIDNLC